MQSKCKIKSPNLITQKITPNKIPNNNNPCFYSSLLGQTTTHRLTTTIKPRHHNQNVVQRQFHTSSPVKTNSAKAPTEPPTFYESAEEIKKRFHIHDREDWYDVPLQVLRGTPARYLFLPLFLSFYFFYLSLFLSLSFSLSLFLSFSFSLSFSSLSSISFFIYTVCRFF